MTSTRDAGSEFGHGLPPAATRGFTLIELLVVVGIIALLVAILMPSLARARQQSQLVNCQANLRQIATSIATYQAEADGHVPVVFNYAASVLNASNPPARACWISVALRKYDAGTTRLQERYGGRFDPEAAWNFATKNAYESTAMPRQYACPFQRDRGAGREHLRESDGIRHYEKRGRFESVQTWLWENIVRGQLPPHGKPWPDAKGADGLPKYPVFSWNRVSPKESHLSGVFPDGTEIQPVGGALWVGTGPKDPSKRAYRRWTIGDVRRLRASGFAGATVAFCAQGEHILGDQPAGKLGLANRGSHRRNSAGGTNAIFADMHVEWVPGTQIGWP